ncbi:MAG: VCBS repeat-containing protein, partial [Kiritimatiellaeota bacterium]|nr:VCBS repeat-containing protein [Kiritimatiellota bacterium]
PTTGYWLLGCLHKYYRTFTVIGGTFGGPTWIPVPGDYDGDGRNDLCLFESNTGIWMLYTMAGQFAQGPFGWKGCVPVPGDYDGDGRTDLVIYDTKTGMWYIYCMSGAYYEGRFGGPGALPITKGRF